MVTLPVKAFHPEQETREDRERGCLQQRHKTDLEALRQ